MQFIGFSILGHLAKICIDLGPHLLFYRVNPRNKGIIHIFIHKPNLAIFKLSLSNALKQTGFADALKKLGLDTGTGSDGKLPSTSGKIRVIRQSESKECTKVLDNWKSFNASGDQGVPSKMFFEN